jgi:IPT/TIG domain
VDVTGYTLAGPPPAVTAITPTSGSTSGGTVVTVTGTLLTGASAVTFGGTAGNALTVLSDTQLRITSPGHPAGVVDIQITTAGGTSATGAADKYTYVPAGVQLSPTVTIADGRAASAKSGGYLNNVNASGFVFSDGTVRFGANYERVATIRGVNPTIVGTKVAAFESSSQDPPAILFSDLDGSNRQRFTKPADGVIIAATPNGWLESVVAADGIP